MTLFLQPFHHINRLLIKGSKFSLICLYIQPKIKILIWTDSFYLTFMEDFYLNQDTIIGLESPMSNIELDYVQMKKNQVFGK